MDKMHFSNYTFYFYKNTMLIIAQNLRIN